MEVVFTAAVATVGLVADLTVPLTPTITLQRHVVCCSALREVGVFSGHLWSTFLTFLCLSLKYVSEQSTFFELHAKGSAFRAFKCQRLEFNPKEKYFPIGGIINLSQKGQIN